MLQGAPAQGTADREDGRQELYRAAFIRLSIDAKRLQHLALGAFNLPSDRTAGLSAPVACYGKCMKIGPDSDETTKLLPICLSAGTESSNPFRSRGGVCELSVPMCGNASRHVSNRVQAASAHS